MNLSKAYNPKTAEGKIYALWEKSGFFNPDKLSKRHKKPFTIVIPPPNVTGSLHMGHALNGVVQDILIRWKRMQGFKTLWLPGTDHAGIATQNVVEKELKKEGKTRHHLGREKFLKRVWQWKEKYGNIILDQFKELGCSCDWSRNRFTMDKDYTKAVQTAFSIWCKKGWIYQGKRVINWCPRCESSLSDLELEYKSEKGKLWYIRYPLAQGRKSQIANRKSYIVVATTRPETMLGDTAVAVNPDDKRYKNLIGKKVILPLANREIPIVADKAVDKKFGTGALKVTPGHDLVDFEISQRHKLPILKVIDERGEITKPAPIPYQGLSAIEARHKVVENLKKQGLLKKIEPHQYSIAKCYRCGTIIEPQASKQWFLKMDKLAQLAIKAVKSGQVKFHPKRWEKTYFNWLENIKDWCISRQIWWGHRLPIWQSEIKNKKSKIKNYVGDNPPEGYKQVSDVLDTWFSSALWPFATLGWPIANAQNQKSKIKNKKLPDLKRFYPTDILSTARDIINLWVARMIFSGLDLVGKKPFSDIYVHPTVLTITGKRMSKSLGTGTDPLEIIEKYGADATRFGISWQIMAGQDIKFVEDNMVMGKKFCNKIWNAARFALANKPSQIYTNLGSLRSPHEFTRIKNLTSADKKILKALNSTIKTVNKDLEKFRFGPAARRLYDFFWHDFCDVYIEESKKQKDEKTQKILLYTLLTSLKLLHPFIPFVTEEIYQEIPLKHKKECLMVEEWPK